MFDRCFSVKPLWLPDITVAAEGTVFQHPHAFNIAVRNSNTEGQHLL
jgi:hypothetical protein